MSKVTRKDIIEKAAEKMDTTKGFMADAFDSIFEAIEEYLIDGAEIGFQGFGTFKQSIRKATTNVNPYTGEDIEVPQKRIITFRTSQILKNQLNQ